MDQETVLILSLSMANLALLCLILILVVMILRKKLDPILFDEATDRAWDDFFHEQRLFFENAGEQLARLGMKIQNNTQCLDSYWTTWLNEYRFLAPKTEKTSV